MDSDAELGIMVPVLGVGTGQRIEYGHRVRVDNRLLRKGSYECN